MSREWSTAKGEREKKSQEHVPPEQDDVLTQGAAEVVPTEPSAGRGLLKAVKVEAAGPDALAGRMWCLCMAAAVTRHGGSGKVVSPRLAIKSAQAGTLTGQRAELGLGWHTCGLALLPCYPKAP